MNEKGYKFQTLIKWINIGAFHCHFFHVNLLNGSQVVKVFWKTSSRYEIIRRRKGNFFSFTLPSPEKVTFARSNDVVKVKSRPDTAEKKEFMCAATNQHQTISTIYGWEIEILFRTSKTEEMCRETWNFFFDFVFFRGLSWDCWENLSLEMGNVWK